MQLSNGNGGDIPALAPYREMGAYEAIWNRDGMSFKKVADLFRDNPSLTAADLVDEDLAFRTADQVMELFTGQGIDRFGVSINGSYEYPSRLRDARHPVEFLYYQGDWNLVFGRSVAVIGTRNPTQEGISRARKLVRSLVKDEFIIVSGLATGIDTIAHETAIKQGGRTMAVIGTALHGNYPKANANLQAEIRSDHLLISQIPALRYDSQDYRINRRFFPERNVTMSALTDASIIVEAGETSGTLIQARAAIAQSRKLFILDSCFENPRLTWPARFEKLGAVRVREYKDVRDNLT